MIKHIVQWNHRENFSEAEKKTNAEKIKNELESLKEKIDGVVSIKVIIDPLATSDRDIILDSEFETEEALQQYQIHPEHVRVSEFVKECVQDRVCVDYQL
ncbi:MULTISPECIES: Dabb family protein [Oceanobacillus]|uniref:Dabb family protein n=1 Tax=Oceanobacillus aidingensis TaxID=645964 RepID=A0ABV9JXB1_9BACI|nr:Dabb family protein [Oceanobacillus oncorhynchi]MDM8099994.1 Dabb family protein [Oceanobacillus oncorhynchi]UUI40544.1 Dabb family protein [Oceanobacillus oncorhynchi]